MFELTRDACKFVEIELKIERRIVTTGYEIKPLSHEVYR